jgi:GNAT superfamily N-acetyltransferase
VNIRNAFIQELPVLRELRINAYKEHEHKINKDHWKVLSEQISKEVEMQPEVEQMVAEIDGKIVGTVVLFAPQMDAYSGLMEEEPDYPELRMLAVSPDARGKGVASALIKECIQRAKNKGFTALGLHTADFMESAIALYGQLGFERLPQFDFEPANDGIIVKAFRITF